MEALEPLALDTTTSLVEQIGGLQLNDYTRRTIQGKPFPSDLAPSLPPYNAERLATVEEVIKASKMSKTTLRPVLQLLCKIMQMETACVSLVTEQGSFIQTGVGNLDSGVLYTLPGICPWTLVPEKPQALIVEDMLLDARTSTRPMVTMAPFMRCYVAAPLMASNGHKLGTLCLLDPKPHSFDSERVALLCNFAELVTRELEAPAVLLSRTVSGQLRRPVSSYRQAYLFVDVSSPGWQVLHANQAFCEQAGMQTEDAVGSAFWDLFSLQELDSARDACRDLTEELDSKQTVVIKSLQRRGNQSQTSTTYNATLRPASTDAVDRDAIMIGIPSGSLSAETCSKKHNFYFVMLDDAEPAPLSNRSASTRALRLGPLLGAGTFGRVYRGMLGKEKVAVKVVDMLSSLAKIGNVPLEAALMQGLQHPCIVGLLEHKIRAKPSHQTVSPEVSHQLWLVLQYCDRGSLEEAVDKGLFRTARIVTAEPCMPTILRTALEIAQGLAFLHSHNILHCDISSANVLLHSRTPNAHGFAAKLADFGACIRTDMTQSSSGEDCSVRGTFTHLSPEVLDGQPCSKESDVYAYGVLLYEMYCGQHPWAGLHPAQVMYAMTHEQQTLEVPESAPPAFRLLACRCMSKIAGERPVPQEITSILEEQIAQLED